MTLPLQAGTWMLDPAHSVVGFGVRHLGISTLTGRFGIVEASVTVGESAADSSLNADIDLSSVDTGNADRDGHLRSTDFFDVEAKPKMTFASTSITEGSDGAWRVGGDLTLAGTSKPIELAVAFFGVETNPLDSSTRAGFRATGSIDRTDYGIDWNVPLSSGGVMLGKQVDITLDVQLIGPGE